MSDQEQEIRDRIKAREDAKAAFVAAQVARLQQQPARRTKGATLPEKRPNGLEFRTHAGLKDQLKSKYVPREPKDGEVLAVLDRPQLSPRPAGGADRGFAVYKAGDVLLMGDASYVVQAAKESYTRSGEGWKRWEQAVVLRAATDDDHAAVAPQKEEQDKASKAVMDRAMWS